MIFSNGPSKISFFTVLYSTEKGNTIMETRPPHGSNKCITQDSRGQCRFFAVEGSDHCERHAAHLNLKKLQKQEIYSFQRSQFLALSEEENKVYETQKYNLSAELGVCRMMLQKYMDKVVDFDTLMQYDHKMTTLVDRIAKISESVLKADQKLGTLMSEEDALSIAQGLLDAVHTILSDRIDDPAEFAKAMEETNQRFMKVIDAER